MFAIKLKHRKTTLHITRNNTEQLKFITGIIFYWDHISSRRTIIWDTLTRILQAKGSFFYIEKWPGIIILRWSLFCFTPERIAIKRLATLPSSAISTHNTSRVSKVLLVLPFIMRSNTLVDMNTCTCKHQKNI